MKKTIISVDPGASGGIAWKGSGALGVRPMPEDRSDLIALIRQLVNSRPSECVAYVEQLAPFIPNASQSSMFNYGIQAERPGCILECLGVRIVPTPPKRWQKELGLAREIPRIPTPKPPKHLDKRAKSQWNHEHADEIKEIERQNSRAQREWKKFLEDQAFRRFPTLTNVTLKSCDALLILDYGCKLEGEMLL